MTTVGVQVLGPLRIFVDGVERPIGGRRERTTLAVLAAASGSPVHATRLIDELWGEQAPASAPGSLQVAVSRLRSVLEPDRAPGVGPTVLARVAGGYALCADVDAQTFSRLAHDATGPDLDPLRRLEVADEALRLWRGEPYAGLDDVPSLVAEVTRLRELWLALVEVRADALLDLGRPDQARALLAPLVPTYPFRERLWASLALALYRCGRQADALSTLRTLREHLVEELGVDPSPSVRQMENDLLAQVDSAAPSRATPRSPLRTERDLPAEVPRSPGLVGRTGLISKIDHLLLRLVDHGEGGVVLLTGEAGIGKSVLSAELAARAITGGARVAWGRCHEADVSPAYWPWLPVLRATAGPTVSPEVAVLLGEGGSRPPELVDAAAAALRTYDAVTRVLRAATAGGPLVVVLEDVHWADASSLRLLTFAAETLAACPLLLVATMRDVDATTVPGLAHAMAGLARLGAKRFRVPGLAPPDVAELVDGVIGHPDASLADVLANRTDGNPFFVLEMARLLAGTDRATAEDAARLDVPDGVADVLRLRVQRLGDGARTALGAASVAGRSFDAPLVAGAIGVEVDVVLDSLDEALSHGVIQDEGGSGRLRFVHALTRETVYGDLPSGLRGRLHARVGAALAERLDADPDLLTQVAHHYGRASTLYPQAAEPAVRYAEAGAVAAEARGAFDEALELWVRAVEAERRVPVADPARRHRLLLGLATARQRIGDFAGMRATLDEAVATARAAGDWRRVAEAATSFRGAGVWHWREFGTKDEAMVEVLETCVDHVDDLELQARLLASLQMEHTFAWRSAEADACGTRAIEVARELMRTTGETDTLRDCLSFRVLSLWGPGTAAARECYARESLELPLGPEQELAARFYIANALHQQGRSDEADREMARASKLAADLRHTGCDVPLAWWEWMRAVELESPEADAVAQRALAMHRRTSVVGLVELVGHVAVICAAIGSDVAPDVVASAVGHPNPAFRAVVAYGLAAAGRIAEAADLLGEPTPLGARDYAVLFADCLRLDVLVDAGLVDRIPGALARVSPYVDEVATYGNIDSLGSAAYFVGRGLEALGDHERAVDHVRRAVEANHRSGCLKWERIASRELERLTAGKSAGKAAATSP